MAFFPTVSWPRFRRNLTALVPLSAFLYNSFLLINLLHYSTLPSLKIWSWPKTFAAHNSDSDGSGTYYSWVTLEVAIQAFSLLFSVYLFLAVLVSIVGTVGVLKSQVPTIRFYRDCAIADLSFGLALTVLMGYGAFFFSELGLGVSACDELSRNPVIMRSLSMDPESCEQWTERWLFAGIIGMVISSVIRLHAILFISKYHNRVLAFRAQRGLPLNLSDLSSNKEGEERGHRHYHHHRHSSSMSSRRVLLLPAEPSSASGSSSTPPMPTTPLDGSRVLVYAPTSMTVEEARQLSSSTTFQEAFVSRSSSSTNPATGKRRHHHHHHGHGSQHHHRRRSSGGVAREDTWANSEEEEEGGIALPSYPGEPLK